MRNSTQIFDLLEEALTTGRPPEEICAEYPALLDELRHRIALCQNLDSELDGLFPSSATIGQPDQMAALPQIDGFVITDVLGRGGIGVVYRARQTSLNRDVALKMLLTGKCSTSSELYRFSREAQALGRLRHANIVQVYDVGTVGGQPYFTMELIENGTLAKRLDGRPIRAAEAAALTITLAGAVDAAHRAGIVHRDLKPANILIAVDGSPKIADFGLARHFGDELAIVTQSAQVGTPGYMAPEQVRGTQEATEPPVDVYALGAILYEFLTGHPPFRGETSAQTQQQVLETEPTPPTRLNSQVPRDLETICLKCLRKSANQRYESAAALAADLQRFLNDEPILARPTGYGERLFKWTKRHPAWTVTIALFLVTVVGGSIGLMRLRSVQHERQRTIDTSFADIAAHGSRAEWTKAREVLRRLAPADRPPSAALAERIRAAEHNLNLLAQLDAIRLERVANGGVASCREKVDANYRDAFKRFLSIAAGDGLEDAAAKIDRSGVKAMIVVAVEDWAVSTDDTENRRWLLDLAKRIQPGDQAGWSDRIRNAERWSLQSELTDLAAQVPTDHVPLSTHLILAERLKTFSSIWSSNYLRRVQRANPSDFWLNLQLGADTLWMNPKESQAFCRTALAIRPNTAVAYVVLADAIRPENPYDAINTYRAAMDMDPSAPRAHTGLGNALADIGRFKEAMECHDRALVIDPEYAWAHFNAGKTLMKFQRIKDAATRYQQAVNSMLNERAVHQTLVHRNLRLTLMLSGQVDDAIKPWRDAMASEPMKYDPAAGYAELCAYLGREEEYEVARRDLLRLSNTTTYNPNIQAIVLACLLRPASGDVLKALGLKLDKYRVRMQPSSDFAYNRYLFNKGLLAYRQGRFDDAIKLLEADQNRFGPCTQLVLAMALVDAGRSEQARGIFESAVYHYDWRPGNIGQTDFGIYHVLRREAEQKLVPNLAELLVARDRPLNSVERAAMLGTCVERNMNEIAARIYAEAFKENPALGRYVSQSILFQASCAAAASGSDLHRAQALRWLSDDLALKRAKLPGDPQSRARLQCEFGTWLADPELASVREPESLQRLSSEERQAWQTLWRDVEAAMDRLDTSRRR